MAESKKPTGSKDIADVAQPGKSAPSDTSKSIITRRPIMKDPMVVEDEADKPDTAPKKPLLKQSGETKIEPLSASTTESTDEKKPAVADKLETESEPSPAKPEAPDSDEPADADKASTDKKPKQEKEEAAVAAQAKQDAKLQKIVDNKKYFLPINAIEQRRSKQFVILGIFLALLLAVAWVDVALDAGLIKIGNVKPVTHFFSN